MEFNRRAVEINGKAITWDVFNVYDKKVILDAIRFYLL